MPTSFSAGSLNHIEPRPPFQPYWPTAGKPVLRVVTRTPMPQPSASHMPGSRPPRALFSADSWSEVISSTSGRESSRVPLYRPPPSSIRAKTR